MQTIKEYAIAAGISYQAARKTVEKYADDLKGHVVTQGRTRYLDDEAVRVLNEHRAPKTLILGAESQRAEIERLRSENDDLKNRLIASLSALNDVRAKLQAAEDESRLLLGYQQECEMLQLEIASLRNPPTLWSRIRRRMKRKD